MKVKSNTKTGRVPCGGANHNQTLILWHPWPAATTQLANIYDYKDGGFLIEVGCLRCCLYTESGGSILDFVAWVTYQPTPGVVREQRMAPSEILKKKLEEVGIPAMFEGHPVYPSLVARIDRLLTPYEVAEKLQQTLRSCNWSRLYHDPDSSK